MTTEAEARFARLRARVGLVAAPASFVAVLAADLGLPTPETHRLAAVAAFTVVAWLTECLPLPMTALLAPALATLFGVAPAAEAFAAMAHPLIFLFLGGFVLAEALACHGVDRRVALWIVSRPAVADRPTRAAVALVALAFVASMWISNTATTAVMLPILAGFASTIGRSVGDDPERAARHRAFVSAVSISVAYAASLGGMTTPVGTGPNLVALGILRTDLGIYVDFAAWMSFALPVAVPLALVQVLVVLRRAPPAAAVVPGLRREVAAELAALGPPSPAERRTVFVFLLAVAGWLAPAVLRLAVGADHPWTAWSRAHLPEGVVAVVAAGLAFLVPSGRPDRGALLSWERAARIDWGTLLLLGGGLCLGDLAMTTGLAEALGRAAIDAAGPAAASPIGLFVAAVALVVFLTEVTSNTATTAMMLPVVVGIARAAGIAPAPTVIGVTLAASCAFMLPVATPPNAMVYGSGLVSFPQMLRFGFVLDLVAIAVLAALGATALPALLPAG